VDLKQLSDKSIDGYIVTPSPSASFLTRLGSFKFYEGQVKIYKTIKLQSYASPECDRK
jgi:hypothetical protein